ncbi:MAG TPA: hypothetical protein VM033_06140, partial [Gemmatimonadaceae bacterium]|nr:hypothetical protein [Gemmatimonadaceae bacterium]
YPFSHALEEIGALHHEEVARPLITGGEVAGILRAELGDDAPDRIMALIRGTSASPLQDSSPGRSTWTRSSTSSATRTCAA